MWQKSIESWRLIIRLEVRYFWPALCLVQSIIKTKIHCADLLARLSFCSAAMKACSIIESFANLSPHHMYDFNFMFMLRCFWVGVGAGRGGAHFLYHQSHCLGTLWYLTLHKKKPKNIIYDTRINYTIFQGCLKISPQKLLLKIKIKNLGVKKEWGIFLEDSGINGLEYSDFGHGILTIKIICWHWNLELANVTYYGRKSPPPPPAPLYIS